MKRKNEEKNQTPMRCPMCGASAVESCKKPEKKETGMPPGAVGNRDWQLAF
jgi:hypothetical protein